MSRAEPLRQRSDYYSIKDGSFRLPATPETPDVIRREYKNPRTGAEGVAYELGFEALFGVIEDIRFQENTLKDGTNLRSLNIILDADEDGKHKVISLPVEGRYASDFLKKLPNIDLTREVKLKPYDFEKDGPRRVGIAVFHADANGVWGESVKDAFVQVDLGEGGRKSFTTLNGFPEPTEEDKEDWKFYFTKVNKFLVKYAKENVLPKLTALEKKNMVMEKGIEDVYRQPTEDELNNVPF